MSWHDLDNQSSPSTFVLLEYLGIVVHVLIRTFGERSSKMCVK